MSKRLKSRPIEESSRIKTVEETMKVYEHKCTAECFKPLRRPTPPDLRRVSLGYVYMSSNGGIYTKWGKGGWLPVDGMDFGQKTNGALFKIFHPTVQLHIHSPGGRTLAKTVTEKEITPDEKYHAQEAVKIRKRKGDNLKETLRFFGPIAREEIHYAPKKRRPPKSTGRGAPGQPRRPFSKKVVSLRNEGMTEHQVVNEMIIWLREQGQSVTPPQRSSIRKRVHRWFLPLKKKSEHK
jgi:hypothetical protein